MSIQDAPPEIVALHGQRELVEHGYRPIILRLYAEGRGPKEISRWLRERHGIQVHYRPIETMVRSFGDQKDLIAAAMRHEADELKQMAYEDLHKFRSAFWQAHQERDDKMMAILQGAYERWWDRMGRFHFELQPGLQATQVNILIADPKLMVREEVRNADDAARILARLESTEVARKSDQGVKRAEDAARPEEAPGSQ